MQLYDLFRQKGILTLEKCAGCGACVAACPHNAITMKLNSEGFRYPEINHDLCVKCGLCEKSCAIINPIFENENSPECYAVMAEDEIRFASSSGGVFPVLAQTIIQNGGVVCGAAFDALKVKHIIVDNLDDLYKLKGSKYLQSDATDCYTKIKEFLDNGVQVLFVGTPCQVAGVKSYLKKTYQNLLCIDVVCHGVPSEKVFEKYIAETIKPDEKVLNTNFRDKSQGWGAYKTIVQTSQNTYTHNVGESTYLQVFLHNLSLRKSCAQCPFQTIPRQGDITIGDFWGIGQYDKNLDDDKGTSLVLINNRLGKEFFQSLVSDFKHVEKVPIDVAVKWNRNLTASSIEHHNRELFFEQLDKKTLKENIDLCLNDKCDYLIVNFWQTIGNYGAVLTVFAMQEMLKNFGFIPKVLNYRGEEAFSEYRKIEFYKFVKKYLNLTKPYQRYELRNLSKQVKGVILGSDQVLRPCFITNVFFYTCMLNFCNINIRKLAISASFGLDKEEFLATEPLEKPVYKYMKSALSSFDYLSCREISGTEIFKDVFGLNSDVIIDPVFLVDKSLYYDIIATVENSSEDYIAIYVFDEKDKYENLYSHLQTKYKVSIKKLYDTNLGIAEWLAAIKNCKLLITDSFHGSCFAMILNKPFICVRNKDRGNTRLNSIIELFGIGNNIVDSVNDIYEREIIFDMDYKEINEKIEKERQHSLAILENVLMNDYSNNPDAYENKIKNEKYLKKLRIRQGLLLELCKNYIIFTVYRICTKLFKGQKKQHFISRKRQMQSFIERYL